MDALQNLFTWADCWCRIVQKSEKFYLWHTPTSWGLSSVLYNPPRLKGFPNFPSSPSLSVLPRLTSPGHWGSPLGGLTFKSHQEFRLNQLHLDSSCVHIGSFSSSAFRSWCISKWSDFFHRKLETDPFTWWFLYFWMNHIIHKLAEYLSIRLYRDHSSCLY